MTNQIDYLRDAQGNLIDYASGNPIANLELIQSIFFANPGYSLECLGTMLTDVSRAAIRTLHRSLPE